MTRDHFWQLIDEARQASASLVDLPKKLIEMLSGFADQEIVDFDSHYKDCLFRAYDARLWLAAVVIMGGCGDDTFSDFRGWLIAQGREVFEQALIDPASLANLDREKFDGDEARYPTLFYLGSVANRAFCKRTSGDERDFNAGMRFKSLVPKIEYPKLKSEELIHADDERAKAMFPRLAAKFPKGLRMERL